MAAGDEEGERRAYPAEKARQGDIVLRTKTQRAIFVGGLVGLALIVVLIRFLI